MSIRRYFREVTHAASRLGIQGARVENARGCGHPRLLGEYSGRPVMCVISSTPSDVRNMRNTLANLKRILRQTAAKP